MAASADGSVFIGAGPHTGYIWSGGTTTDLAFGYPDHDSGDRRGCAILVESGLSASSVYSVANAGRHHRRRIHDRWPPSRVAYLAPDADNDRSLDADAIPLPNDPTEWSDRDGDGVGDNGDPFPYDPTETSDTDRDGIGDHGDPFPEDPTRPVRAAIEPGDLLLAAGEQGLIRIDPASGDVGWVAYGAGFVAHDVIAAPSGAIYVADHANERIVRADENGAVTVVADGLVGVLGLDAREHLLVSTYADGVFRVDPATGRSRSLEVGYATSIHTDAFGDTFACRRRARRVPDRSRGLEREAPRRGAAAPFGKRRRRHHRRGPGADSTPSTSRSPATARCSRSSRRSANRFVSCGPT